MNLKRIIDENKVIDQIQISSKSNFKWTITFCFFTWLSRIFNKTVASGNVRRFNSGILANGTIA
ncbi:MAG: hypothetical protein Ct9H90mP2_00580 [Dehalococcoidia bacterium]|nr:MAG: hypothetical protein Ct9H90mP2_00580 [Dehalococcoidia bacterium]